MATKTVTAPTLAAMEDISAAHGVTDEALAARVKAVHAALAAGTDVKTLATSMAEAAKAPRSKVVAVGQAVLGYAKAAGDILTGTGVTPDYADASHVKALAETYRAVMRHGSTVARKELVAAGIGGKTPAAKVARLTKAATASTEAAKVARKAATPKARVKVTPGVNQHTKAIRDITGGIARGAITVTPDMLAAIAALVEAAKVAAPKVTATPATVAAAKTPASV